MKRTNLQKGQIAIMGILITAFATVFASGLGAWGISSRKVNALNTKVQVVEERERNHYSELSKKMDSLAKDMKILINRN